MRVAPFTLLVFSAALAGPIGCGSTPPPRPLVDDVFHDVFLRGAPGAGDTGRVALTVDGPGPCTDRLLAASNAHGLVVTLMVDPGRLEAAAEADGPALRATLARIDTDGHGLGLAPAALPADWDDPAGMRQGLLDATRAARDIMAAHGIQPPPLRAWRPPSADRTTLAAARAAERPLVLWSLRAPAERFEPALPQLLDRLTDGDIVALPAGRPGDCAVADAIPRIAAALKAAELQAVTLDALLEPQAARYAPPRVVRFRGPAPSAACLSLAGDPATREPAAADADDAAPEPANRAPRWGLVHDDGPDGVVVLPLPFTAETTAELFAHRAAIDRRWAERTAWAARPACLRTLTLDRLLAPVAAARGERPIDWWVVGDDAVERREARALGRPGGPTLLPDRADLARFEARQRVPWQARGVVAGALESLDLDVPLLTELRQTTAVLVGLDLTPNDADDEAKLRRAVAGFLPVAELSMGEYLFLAESLPGSAVALRRTARAADGFLRPGPMLVLAAAGRGPDARRLTADGERVFAASPAALLARVLRAGRTLKAGDVVAAQPPPPRGAPLVFPTGEAESMAAALRTALGRSLLVAMMLPVYLRPGATRRFDGDLFGRWRLRVAVPAGVAAPATEVAPIGTAEPPAEPPPEAEPDDENEEAP